MFYLHHRVTRNQGNTFYLHHRVTCAVTALHVEQRSAAETHPQPQRPMLTILAFKAKTFQMQLHILQANSTPWGKIRQGRFIYDLRDGVPI